MTFTIVASGQSAENWIPRGHSIGCNDAWKWGKPTDSLIVCNRPQQFTPERLKVILESKPKEFYSDKSMWSEWFPDWKKLSLKPWYGVVHPKQIYYSNTSPFIAVCLAVSLGAKEIIIWGVDFINHKIYNDGNPQTAKEVERYLELFRELRAQGVNVYLGNTGSVFDDKLPVYEEVQTV